MTLLSDVVRTSTQVAGTPSRLAKVRELADCLGRLEPDEIRIAIPYLSGEIRQGKLSLGYASLQSARAARAPAPTLALLEVDRAFEELKSIKGKGAAARRERRLARLFGRATAEEQDFLARLIVGERLARGARHFRAKQVANLFLGHESECIGARRVLQVRPRG